LEEVTRAALQLQERGVRAIVGAGGRLLQHQRSLSNAIEIPVCLSPVLYAPFVSSTWTDNRQIGILSYESSGDLLNLMSKNDLDVSNDIEVLTITDQMITDLLKDKPIKDIYNLWRFKSIICDFDDGRLSRDAISNFVDVPVFDVVSLVDFLYDAAVQRNYRGFY